MEKLGLIGGSFDPIHLAHLYIAEKAKEKLELDKMIFIPAGSQPLKQDKKATKASLRLYMVKEAIKDIEGFEVSDYEIEKQGLSYTFETLEHFTKKDRELYFITGADCLLTLDKWENIQRILSLCVFVVFTRPGFDNEKLEGLKKYYEEKYNGKIVILELPGLNISSTDIREKIKNGERIEDLLPQSVIKIIKEERIYGEGYYD